MRFHIPTSALQRRSENPVWKSGRKTRSENTLASKCLDKMSRAKLSLSLYKANLSLLRHSSTCILCGISNSFIQIHIANSCTCFSCASLLRTMRYDAAGAQLPRAPDRTLDICYPLCPSLLSKTYRRSPCTWTQVLQKSIWTSPQMFWKFPWKFDHQ